MRVAGVEISEMRDVKAACKELDYRIEMLAECYRKDLIRLHVRHYRMLRIQAEELADAGWQTSH